MSEELKPCPFCGGKAILDSHGRYVYCTNQHSNCDIRPHTKFYDTPDEAVQAWNKRAILTEELNPCPFCQSIHVVLTEINGVCHVKCKDCGASTTWDFPSRKVTAYMWNSSVIVSEHSKQCPFCGSEAILRSFGRHAWYIRCENPDCAVRPHTHTFKTQEDAIEDWNRRGIGEFKPLTARL